MMRRTRKIAATIHDPANERATRQAERIRQRLEFDEMRSRSRFAAGSLSILFLGIAVLFALMAYGMVHP